MFEHMLKESKADERLSIYELASSQTADGKDFYAYLAIIPSKYEAYKIALSSGNPVQFTKYGDVILTGWGKEPSAEIVKEMEDIFYMNHNFETEIMNFAKNASTNVQLQSSQLSNQVPSQEEC